MLKLALLSSLSMVVEGGKIHGYQRDSEYCNKCCDAMVVQPQCTSNNKGSFNKNDIDEYRLQLDCALWG